MLFNSCRFRMLLAYPIVVHIGENQMMELKNLVELLYTAYQRFTSIQVAWHYEYSVHMMQVAQRRWVEMNPPGSVAMLTSQSTEAIYNTQVQVQNHIWWQKPASWRKEWQLGNKDKTTIILCNGQWWSFSDPNRNILYTNVTPDKEWLHSGIHIVTGHPPDLQQLIVEDPLLDPSFLLTSHHLEPTADSVHIGREAVQVRAVYQKGQDYIPEAFFWATADEYHLLIDKEYGILLRYAAILDGAEYAVSSVKHVVFDALIPAETFVFTTLGFEDSPIG